MASRKKKDTTPMGREMMILAALEKGSPMSYKDYEARAGVSHTTAARHLEEAHRNRVLHIARWERRVGPPTAYYALGDLPDAERLKTITPTEHARNYRAKVYADPKRHAALLKTRRAYARRVKNMLQRQRDWAAKKRAREVEGLPNPKDHDPILAALMGVKRSARK